MPERVYLFVVPLSLSEGADILCFLWSDFLRCMLLCEFCHSG
jgi:hypothetical protein